jgi:hypothetical protein
MLEYVSLSNSDTRSNLSLSRPFFNTWYKLRNELVIFSISELSKSLKASWIILAILGTTLWQGTLTTSSWQQQPSWQLLKWRLIRRLVTTTSPSLRWWRAPTIRAWPAGQGRRTPSSRPPLHSTLPWGSDPSPDQDPKLCRRIHPGRPLRRSGTTNGVHLKSHTKFNDRKTFVACSFLKLWGHRATRHCQKMSSWAGPNVIKLFYGRN